jgi:hypothetical protein
MKSIFLIISLLFTSQAFAKFIAAKEYKFPVIDYSTATLASGIIKSHDNFPYTVIKFRSQKNERRQLRALKVRFYQSETPSTSLVYVLTGIGGDASSGTSNFLATELLKQGHHVMVIPSVFTREFADSYSSSGYVGLLNIDSKDMIELFMQTRSYMEEIGLPVKTQNMVGYSLGALTAAHLSEEAAKLPGIEFNKVLLINPPVDLIYGLRFLDKAHSYKMSEIYFLRLGLSVIRTIKAAMSAPLDLDSYTMSLENFKFLSVDECNFFIAESLSSSLTGVLEGSQDAFDLEILPEKPLSNSAGEFYQRADRNRAVNAVNFETYIQNFVVPYFRDHNDGSDDFKSYSLNSMNLRVSMYAVAKHIRANPKIYLMTNTDDFLLRGQADIDYLSELFGERATFYPRGGHIGNIWYKDNMDLMLKLLK